MEIHVNSKVTPEMKASVKITPRIIEEIRLTKSAYANNVPLGALVYDPMIRQGLYRVTLNDVTKQYRADGAFHAVCKLCKFLNVSKNQSVNAKVTEIECEIRASDLA